jgi:hypothetical protein
MHHLTDQETIDLELEIYLFVSEYLETNAIEHHDPQFYDKLVGLATDEYFSICACMDIYENADDYDEAYTEIRNKIGTQIREYFNMLSVPRRQYLNPRQKHYSKSKGIDAKIEKLRSAYQPAQRTPEWYAFRNNLVTAQTQITIVSFAKNAVPIFQFQILQRINPMMTMTRWHLLK